MPSLVKDIITTGFDAVHSGEVKLQAGTHVDVLRIESSVATCSIGGGENRVLFNLPIDILAQDDDEITSEDILRAPIGENLSDEDRAALEKAKADLAAGETATHERAQTEAELADIEREEGNVPPEELTPSLDEDIERVRPTDVPNINLRTDPTTTHIVTPETEEAALGIGKGELSNEAIFGPKVEPDETSAALEQKLRMDKAKREQETIGRIPVAPPQAESKEGEPDLVVPIRISPEQLDSIRKSFPNATLWPRKGQPWAQRFMIWENAPGGKATHWNMYDFADAIYYTFPTDKAALSKAKELIGSEVRTAPETKPEMTDKEAEQAVLYNIKYDEASKSFKVMGPDGREMGQASDYDKAMDKVADLVRGK